MKSNKRFAIIAVALTLALFATACSFSVSTANIQDAIMTNSIDADGKPGEEVVSFPADASVLYVSALLRNAPDNTQVKFVWTYVTNNQLIDELTLDSGDVSDRYIYSNLEPTAPLPTGDYMVQIFIDEREEPDATVKFVVVEAQTKEEVISSAYLEDAYMTNRIDDQGMPGGEVQAYLPNASMLYVTAKLRSAPNNTQIRFVWTYITGNQLIDEIVLDSGDIADRYIYSNFAPSATLPEGDYMVEIFLDNRTTPDATANFFVTTDSSLTKVIGAETTAGFTFYSQEAGGYSFEYPSDWMLQEFPDQYIAFVYPDEYSVPGEDDLNTVYVAANKGTGAGYTIDTLLQKWVDETNEEGIENYVYNAQSVDTIDGKDFASFSYYWTRGDYQLFTVDVLLIDGADFYLLELTVTEDNYDMIYPLFEHMAISFEIL